MKLAIMSPWDKDDSWRYTMSVAPVPCMPASHSVILSDSKSTKRQEDHPSTVYNQLPPHSARSAHGVSHGAAHGARGAAHGAAHGAHSAAHGAHDAAHGEHGARDAAHGATPCGWHPQWQTLHWTESSA